MARQLKSIRDYLRTYCSRHWLSLDMVENPGISESLRKGVGMSFLGEKWFESVNTL
jgi:hypothetical protein